MLNWIPTLSIIEQVLYGILYSLGPLVFCFLEDETEKSHLGHSLFHPPMLLDNGSSATSAIGYPHQMLMSTCTKDKCGWASIKITTVGVAVPTSSTDQAINIVRDIYDHHPECLPLQGILFRFVKGTTPTLATAAAAVERGQDTLHIEIDVSPGSDGLSRPFYTELRRRLVDEAGARLHWGKNEAFKRANFDVSDFTAYMKPVDPNGRFQNDWSRAVFG
ncbi:hypothetical protein GQ42DRAFT_92783 [Ramicandelaber brevisporus]|nr:hypothetical protein GQ42DRAFT_92783 [Ramicandelaber brevisporus]